MTRSFTAPLLLLSPLLFSLACGRGGPPEGAAPSGGDGGSADGGAGDGGAAAPDVGLMGLSGSADVATGLGGGSYDGSETIYYVGLKGEDYCSITSQVTSVDPEVAECKYCSWAFTLTTSDTTSTCEGADTASFDGATFNYGLYEGDGYDLLIYYYQGYGWYPAYDAFGYAVYPTFAGGSFQYDWPVGYTYLY